MNGRGAGGRGRGGAGRGGGGRRATVAGAAPAFAERRRLHRAVAVGNPVGAAQHSQPPTMPVGASAGSQAVADVATAVRVDHCTGCAACQSACLQGALTVDRFVAVDESLCTGCGDCVDVCAFDVLALRPR